MGLLFVYCCNDWVVVKSMPWSCTWIKPWVSVTMHNAKQNPQSLLLCMDIKVPGKPYRYTITLTTWLFRIFGRPLGKTWLDLIHVIYICNIGRKDVTDVYQQAWWHVWGYHQIMTTWLHMLQMLCTVQLKGNFILAGDNSHVPWKWNTCKIDFCVGHQKGA